MISRSGVMVGGLFVLVLAAARLYTPPAPGDAAVSAVPVATPPGITLQLLGAKDKKGPPALVYADERGMTLYLYRGDSAPGQSTCLADCADTWPPAIAPVDAAASSAAVQRSDWSRVRRSDGRSQWAYRGRPLYRYVKDTAVGEAAGENAADGAWHAAVFQPGAGMDLPDAIALGDLAEAGGTVLTNFAGLTLYTLDAADAACRSRECAARWIPFEAPRIAVGNADFSLFSRDDGITQWRFRGKPLFLYAGDRVPTDVNGRGVDPRFSPALIVRDFMPPQVLIHRDVALGDILASDGFTLYALDIATTEERHEFRIDHGSAALGRALGTSGCDPACTKSWHPLLAPAAAQPCGYWGIVVRDAGQRQWTYKGYALYTYVRDGSGEVKGNETYWLTHITDESGRGLSRGEDSAPAAAATLSPDVYVPTGSAVAGLGLSAMFWRAVVP